jgi:hypothetical protein
VQQDFAQIAQSLQTNDLVGAQHAYSDLVQLTPTGQSANQTPAGSGSNPVPNDLASLGSALQSGSVSSAQDAFSKLKTDLSLHHHHRYGSSAPGASTPAAATETAGPGDGGGKITAGSVFGALVKTGFSLLG